MQEAKYQVPGKRHQETPLYLGATAGMRLLEYGRTNTHTRHVYTQRHIDETFSPCTVTSGGRINLNIDILIPVLVSVMIDIGVMRLIPIKIVCTDYYITSTGLPIKFDFFSALFSAKVRKSWTSIIYLPKMSKFCPGF